MLLTPLFLSTIFGSGNCLQKSQFFNKARSAFSHFLIRDCAALQSKNHFCGKMVLFTHLFECNEEFR